MTIQPREFHMTISRRTFIESLAATSAVALAAGKITGAAAAAPQHNIKRGVAMYSYQEEYFTRVMTVEDCLRQMSDIGAYRIELLAEMMVPDFPNPSNAWVDQWHGWVDKYKMVPTAYTQFIDTMRTKTHNLTVDEGVQTMLRDIRLAKRLGIPKIRALVGTPVEILEATVPYLEKEDIWLGVEIHFPIPIKGHLVERLLKIADKTDHFGFVPDFGIFQNKPNPYLRDRMVRDGVITHDAALYVESEWESKTPKETVLAGVKKMNGGAGAAGYVENVYMIKPEDPNNLVPIMSKCRHIHGKTWGLTEECVDPAIDLTQVIPVLIKAGYNGDIATEYEGQRMVQDIDPFSAVEMVDRHQVMMRRLLGEI
jgi:sugar phosphate isomerase/epimerase